MSSATQRTRRAVENPARRPATPDEARALAHPDRLRIIRLTYDAALTNKELAERLGRNPGTTLCHLRDRLRRRRGRPKRQPRRGRGALPIDRQVVDGRRRRTNR